MTKAIRIYETGGPEVLRWEDVVVGEPDAGQVLLKQTAVGLNYIDTYHRSGLYPLELPATLGMEGAGVVAAVGPQVDDLKAGDRVAYAGGPIGSYAEQRLFPADRLVKLPDTISDAQAAGMMLKGLTVQYLLRLCYEVQAGDTILVQAAAGGVGLLLCQWARHLGATVIGTVGSEEKAALASENGCDHCIFYRREKVSERVREITSGSGVPVVYDSVGRDTFMDSLDCLQPRGLMVTFGQSSGAVDPLPVHELTARGSLFLTRPTLASFVATRQELLANAGQLFEVVTSGAVQVDVRQTYPLGEAAAAHRDLQARQTAGSTVLLP